MSVSKRTHVDMKKEHVVMSKQNI